MAIQYPSINRFCTCTDKYGNLTKAGAKQVEFEQIMHSTPRSYEILKRMGFSWNSMGIVWGSLGLSLETCQEKHLLFQVNSEGVIVDDNVVQKIEGLMTELTSEQILQYKTHACNDLLLPIEITDRMGIKRMCCREVFINPPKLDFIDRCSERKRDITGIIPISTAGNIPEPSRTPPQIPGYLADD